MSYDVYLQIDTGGVEPVSVGHDHNHTYNCSPMFRRALGGDGIRGLSGKLARDCIAHLETAVSHIRHPDNQAEYAAMAPSNLWGNHETAACFLENILADCRLHPKATIRVR